MKKRFLLLTCVGTILSGASAQAQVIYRNVPAAPVQTTDVAPTNVAQEETSASGVVQDASAGSVAATPKTRVIQYTPPLAKQSSPSFPITLTEPGTAPAVSAAPVAADNHVIPADQFGNDIPFNIAVLSILPNGYTASYEGVNQEEHVNWSGGHTWQDTLNVLAAAHGYSFSIHGRQVVFSSQGDVGGTSVPKGSSVVKGATAGGTAAPIGASSEPVVLGGGAVAVQDANSSESIVALPRKQVSTSEAKQGPAPHVEGLPDSNSSRVVLKHTDASDGDALLPNSKSELIAGMPRQSYAPKSGGYGVYYGAAHSSLIQTLRIWASANGWSVQDDTHITYPLDMAVTLKGDFKEVAKTLINSLHVNPRPQKLFYNGNHVLRLYNYEEDDNQEQPLPSRHHASDMRQTDFAKQL